MKPGVVAPIFWLIVLVTICFSCEKECEVNDSRCTESIPENEVCQAYFVRFFYDSESQQCKQRGYSGCTEYGFESREDCLACSCTDQ